MRILITGSSGFIGSALAARLSEKGYEVVGFSRTPMKQKGVTSIVGDVRNKEDILKAVKGVDYVFHLAALAHMAKSADAPQAAMEINYGGTKNLIEALEETNPDVRGVMFSSSRKVYGPSSGVLNENSPCTATDPYSTAKLKAEERCTNSPLCTTILRHSNIYGPGQ